MSDHSEQFNDHSTQPQNVQKYIEDLDKLISVDDVTLPDITPVLNKLLILRYLRLKKQQTEEKSEFQTLGDLKNLIKARKWEQRFEDVDDDILLDSVKLRKYEEEKRDREFREEIPFLEKLSEFYNQKYKLTKIGWTSGWQGWLKELRVKIKTILVGEYTVATVLSQLEEQLSAYNSYYGNWCSSLRAFELLISCSLRDAEKSDHYLNRAVSLMNNTATSTQDILYTIKRNKKRLKTLRELHKLKTSILTSEIKLIRMNEPECPENSNFMRVFTNLVQAAMNQIASDIKEFTAVIVDQCIEFLGEDCPCGLSVIGIGSLARCETTSFSDVEFFFLIQDAKHREYFHRLAIMMYFMIGSLGESNLKTMAIPELKSVDFVDEKPKGFRIDGLGKNAGNMPTGNGVCPDTELIFTLDQFLHEYKAALSNPKLGNSRNVGSTIIDMTAHMTQIWTNSDETNLLTELQTELHLIRLTEKAQTEIYRLLISDIKKCDFLPDLSDHFGQRDVKEDFYRFTSLLLSGLNNLLELHTTDNWECVHKLKSENRVTEKTSQILRFLLASSLYTRIAAYQHYNCQRDSISVLLLDQTNNIPKHHSQYSVNGKLFTLTMSYLFPLKQKLIRVINEQDTGSESQQIFTHQSEDTLSITQDIFTPLIITHFYCDSYSDVIKLFAKKFGEDLMTRLDVTQLDETQSHILFRSLLNSKLLTEQHKPLIDKFTSPNIFRRAYCQGRVIMRIKPSEAVKYFKQCVEYLHDNDQEKRVAVYSFLSECYSLKSDYRECEKYLDLMKVDVDKMFDSDKYSNDMCIAVRGLWLHRFGCLRLRQGRYQDSLRLFQQSLITYHTVYGYDINNANISTTINNIAVCYKLLNKYDQALKYYKKALSMNYALLGEDSSNRHIPLTLFNIGSVYSDMSEFDKAEEFLFKSYNMYFKIYNPDHRDMALCIGYLANFYYKQSRYQESLEWCMKQYDVYSSRSPGDVSIREFALCCSSISSCYFMINQYDKSAEYAIKSYESYEKLNMDNEFVSEVIALCGRISDSYFKRENFTQCVEWCEKAVVLCNDTHVEGRIISLFYFNIGMCYKLLKNKKAAKKQIKLSDSLYVISRREYILFHQVIDIGQEGRELVITNTDPF